MAPTTLMQLANAPAMAASGFDPEDIEKLYGWVEKGMKVTAINAPYKLGWKGSALYLSAVKSAQAPTDAEIHAITQQMAAGASVDWDSMQKSVDQHTGIPVAIGKKKLLAELLR